MKNDYFDVTDKIIIISGGLGQLGRQFSAALLERGAKVSIFDIIGIEGIEAGVLSKWIDNPNLVILKVDITSKKSISNGLDKVVENWGVPHGFVNNAALDSPPDSPANINGPFESYSKDVLTQILNVNITGNFLCCQVIGGRMAEAKRGSIINISSIYGILSPDQRIYEYRRKNKESFFKPAAYAVSKSAILNLTRYLATYWSEKNIRVNTLTLAGVFNNQDENFLEAYCSRVPIGRMANEDEYSAAIIFLLSNASSYMTGSNLIIDGGYSSW